ncbi:MAG: type VI secretion system baseplate subunit TssK [Candidatus Zixiibacteriota bacterium]|nr:MAG: type VI secretion system baseplate subunit TssK [candidate division Zixibacteria bacterium]
MEIGKPIFWHQGLFLQPQHFQLLEHYHAAARARAVLNHHPYYWGVCRLDLQLGELQNEVLEVHRGQLIFPDGTWVTCPGNARMFPRPFGNTKYKEGRPLKVYAGLAKWRSLEANVTVLESSRRAPSVPTRFVAETSSEEVTDLYQAGPAAPVRTMQFAVQFFWEDEIENLGNYHLIPVAQVEHDGREVRLADTFIPPAVTLTGSDALLQVLRTIRDQVTHHARYLERYKRPLRLKKTDMDQNYLVYVLILQALSRHVPQLYHWLESPSVHPWDAYGLLRRLVGELSTFTDRMDLLGLTPEGEELLPPYDHLNLGRCFGRAQQVIEDLLKEASVVPEYIIPLERDGELFFAEIPADSLAPNFEYYLSITTQESLGEEGARRRLIQSVSQVKVSSRKQVHDLITKALKGVELEHRPFPPLGLPKRADSCYFKIDNNHHHWKEYVTRERTISVFWDKAPEDARIQVYVLQA